MNKIEHILHIARLNTRCPECFGNEGLEISFVQEEEERRFYSKFDQKVIETLYCHNCKNIIYPVNWTEDIERVYDYHKKQVVANKAKVKFRSIAYGVLIITLIGIAAGIYFMTTP